MVAISSVVTLGPLDRPQSVLRDGGTSVKVAAMSPKMMWLFGDSIISGSMSDNSMAKANLTSPRSLDPIDPITNQYVPHNDAELKWNSTHDGTQDRFAVWPSTAVRRKDGKFVIGYEVVHIQPSGWITTSVGVAIGKPSDAHPKRYTTFVNSEKVSEWKYGFSWPVSSKDRRVIFFFCLSKDHGDWLSRSVMIAKCPASLVGDRASYRFWNGSVWSPNIHESVYVVPGSAGATAQFSVAWNRYLNLWTGVYMTIGSVCRLITAASPRGPWSDPIDLFTGAVARSGSFDYSSIQHPELQKQDGKVIFISYAHPIAAWDGDMPLVKVVFA